MFFPASYPLERDGRANTVEGVTKSLESNPHKIKILPCLSHQEQLVKHASYQSAGGGRQSRQDWGLYGYLKTTVRDILFNNILYFNQVHCSIIFVQFVRKKYMFMCFKSVIKNYLNVSCLKVNFKKNCSCNKLCFWESM